MTPDGSPERVTFTVPVKPLLVVSVRFICAVELGKIVTCAGVAAIENDGGGGADAEEPPPQPQGMTISLNRTTNNKWTPLRAMELPSWDI